MADLSASHIKFIKGKTNTYSVIRANGATGTLLALYRMLYLKSNYCLYDSDRILYIANMDKLVRDISLAYEGLRGKSEFDNITFFSSLENRVDFLTMEGLLQSYFNQYNSSRINPLKIINPEEVRDIINVSLRELMNDYHGMKLLSGNYIRFFKDEIKWMKSLEYTELESYQACERSGRKYIKGEGPLRLIKNSREREALFKLYKIYEDKLKINNLVDLENRDSISLWEAQRNVIRDYTHIVVDEARSYSRNQLDLAGLLKNERAYGETLYIYDGKAAVSSEAFLTKLSKFNELKSDRKVKSFYFRKSIEGSVLSLIAPEEKMEIMEKKIFIDNNPVNKTDLSIEKFEFISLKNRREFKFLRDITRKDTIVLLDDAENQEVTPEEMKELPMFSNIAAGSPILMNPEIEDTFYLPALWVKGSEGHFILQVKGDSMIGAGIEDGDHVVIKSTPSAQNRDIVAVDLDGSATLKRLVIKGRTAVLMPENEKYEPIPISEEGAHIIGVAVGIIKIH